MDSGGLATHVVKSSPHRAAEAFDEVKLHRSIVAACIASGAPSGHAESMARRVTEEVVIWLESRPEVTSDDLRRVAARYLRTYHPDASYLYEHHRSTF